MMIIKRAYSLIGALVILLFAVVATTIATAQEGGEGAPVNSSEAPEDVVRELFDADGNFFGPDQQLAKVAEEHDGGFGGFYFKDTDEGTAYVFMMDPTDRASAEAAFRAAYHGKHEVTTIIPVKGAYSFDDLLHWYQQLDSALIANDIHPSTGAVMEIKNRIEIGLPDASQFAEARRIMYELGIPEGAVNLIEQDYGQLLYKGDVTDEWRPLVGGIQFEADLTRKAIAANPALSLNEVRRFRRADMVTDARDEYGTI